jgi:hypothetical protein
MSKIGTNKIVMCRHGLGLGPKVFGFWSYDRFPYLLGAPGRLILSAPGKYRVGCFVADGYDGAAFANPVTTTLKNGRELWKRLKRERELYDEEQKMVEKSSTNRVNFLLRSAGVQQPKHTNE